MAKFSPIDVPKTMERKKSRLYFSSCYHYAIEVLRSGGKEKCELPFLGSENDTCEIGTNLRNCTQNGDIDENTEMLSDTSVFFALRYMVEASRVTPDMKTRARSYDELRAYPELYVCDPILLESFCVVALHELERDLEAGYRKLPKAFVDAVRTGHSIMFPVHHRPGIATQYEDAATKEPLSCASKDLHWTLVFAHCRSRGKYDIYHYDSLPNQSSLMYAFKVTHAMLDSVVRKTEGSPVTIGAVRCSFSDRPAWPFGQIIQHSGVKSIENMCTQESGVSCGLFVLGYGLLLAVMRSPLKKSAVEQVTEAYVNVLGVFFARIFIMFYVANTSH